MDNCKKFQDLILTDYIDGEIDKTAKAKIDTHLVTCADCRRLTEDVKKNLITPLESTVRQPVPEYLWGSIKERIESQGRSHNPVSNFLERLIDALSPKWAPALGVIALLVIGSWLLQNQQVQVLEKDHDEYLEYVLSEPGVSADTDDESLGTPIEQYFL